MRILTCFIAYYTFTLYLKGLLYGTIIIETIITHENNPASFFPFWDIFWAALWGGLLYGKLKDAPILKPAFIMAIIMYFGFNYTLAFMELGISSTSKTVIAICAVVGVIGLLATRIGMFIYFKRNPIQAQH
ncbi:hypothetical protein [Paenibacillus luteus]|uniref:hypothetical protein n=1 Tax=Paenibacillus luteus TaxID=2545753 RepID=UPI00114462D2|nr:hypothetical protein [Paenibacillus luteus]